MVQIQAAARKLSRATLALLPTGRAGLAIKVALGIAFAIWWTSGPGADEESEAKAQADPDRRSNYNRHYAFKGRGRKEFLRQDLKDDANELVFTKAGAGVKGAALATES